MPTLYASEKTNPGMLAQSHALESPSADKAGVGAKRGAETQPRGGVAGAQHGRGEIEDERTCLPGHHSIEPASAGRVEDQVLSAPPNITATWVLVVDRSRRPLIPCSPVGARKLLASGRARVHHITPFVIRLVDREIENLVVTGIEVGIDRKGKPMQREVHYPHGGVMTLFPPELKDPVSVTGHF